MALLPAVHIGQDIRRLHRGDILHLVEILAQQLRGNVMLIAQIKDASDVVQHEQVLPVDAAGDARGTQIERLQIHVGGKAQFPDLALGPPHFRWRTLTVSMWAVCGNMSTGCTARSS